MSSFSGEQTPKLPVRRSMQSFDANPVSLSSTRSKTLVRATSCPLDQDSYSSSSDVNSPAPHWVRDGTAHACSQCDQKFSSFCRRHHCRLCGDVYCHKCCNKYPDMRNNIIYNWFMVIIRFVYGSRHLFFQ